MTVYYDDFPMVEPCETAGSAELCMAEILDLLGWKFARSGHKATPFASVFDVLGVTIDLKDVHRGTVVLKNKKSRVESLTALLDRLICDGKVDSGVSASLHGQLNFAQGQFLGAPLKPAMKLSVGLQIKDGMTVSSRSWQWHVYMRGSYCRMLNLAP